MIELEAIAPCSYYDKTGARIVHLPGERFTIEDGQTTWTAQQLADTLVTAQLARPADPRKTKKTK